MSKRQLVDCEDADLSFTDWGDYMEVKKHKLKKQFNEEKKRLQSPNDKGPQIFKDVAIFVNGYTDPSADELKHLIMVYGGRYEQYYSRTRTTYIIATNLPHAKVLQLKKDDKIVKPEWIVESIKAGKLLPWEMYQLYSPVEKLNFKPSDHSISANWSSLKDVRDSRDLRDDVPSTSYQRTNSTVNETRTLRAGEDNFLKEFYSHSRLHHISTAGSKFKEYVNELRKNHNGIFPGCARLREWKTAQTNITGTSSFELRNKIVMHLDMDCFFVSAGLRNRPKLKGAPVAVAHSRGGAAAKNVPRPLGSDIQYEWSHYRPDHDKDAVDLGSLSAISSCNYEARKSGVRNGMMLGEALKICPGLQTIPYDFDAYEEISHMLYDTVASYTLEVEAVSCDELFVDCTHVLRETNTTPLEYAAFLREDIFQKTGCTASAGMGENVLLARLATKKVKPNGQVYLEPNAVDDFIKSHSVKELPGVGFSLRQRLKILGIISCEDLQKYRLEDLQKEFGPKTGFTLYQHCRGKEDRVIQSNKERKSVSAEVNYGIRFQNAEEAMKFLHELSEEVVQRLKSINKKGRSISLKLKVRKKDAPMETAKFMGHGICDNVTRSTNLNIATDSSHIIATECVTLLKNSSISFRDLRGVGIQIGRLDSMEHNQCNSITDYLNDRKSNAKKSPNVIVNEFKSCHTKSKKPKSPEKNEWKLPQASEIDASVLNALPKEIRQEILQAYNISEPVARTTVEPKENASHSQETDLCGAKSLEDVKNLLKEWIDSTEEPADDDIGVCAAYLELLLAENLEKTDLVLKYFHRQVKAKNLQDWKSAYSTIVASVQLTMREIYGSDLRVSNF